MDYVYRRGFTLVELLVVIAIIGILSTTVLASLGGAREDAKISAAKKGLREIEIASEVMFSQTGLYPHKKTAVCPPVNGSNNEVSLASSSAGLVTTDGTYTGWGGPYIASALDPWGTPYFLDEDYQCASDVDGCRGVDFSGANYTSALISCGPDKLTDPGNGNACAYNSDNIVKVYCQL